MFNLAAIADFLRGRGATFVNTFRIDEASKSLFLEIPIELVRVKAGQGFTSKRQITFLRRAIEARFGLRAVPLLRESQQLDDLALGLRALLARKYPQHVVDVFMSFPTGAQAQVWVALRSELQEETRRELQEQISTFLSEAKLSTESIEFLSSALPEPSLVAILRSIKAIAPAPVDKLMGHLHKRGFSCPSEHWLVAKLDAARKRGLLVRSKAADYSLTAAGLELVPHTRSRSSSDIERILFVARRRQW